jgi:hypothetical protein
MANRGSDTGGVPAWAEDLAAATADSNRRSHWHVPPDATERILEHAAAWTSAGGEHAIVDMGSFPLAVSPEADAVELMNLALITEIILLKILEQPKTWVKDTPTRETERISGPVARLRHGIACRERIARSALFLESLCLPSFMGLAP